MRRAKIYKYVSGPDDSRDNDKTVIGMLRRNPSGSTFRMVFHYGHQWPNDK